MKFILFTLFAFSLAVAQAQEPAFVVFHTQGKTTLNGKPSPLKKGDKIFPTDILTVSNVSSIVLLCKNYEALKVETGRHDAKALFKRCQGKEGSYTTSYFKYVWEELSHPHGSPESDPSKFMKNSGAVSRGCDNVETSLLFDTLVYATGSLPVHFKTTIRQPYVTLFSSPENGEVIGCFPLQKPVFQMDSLTGNLERPGTYYWQITTAEAEGCPPHVLQLLENRTYQARVQKVIRNLPPARPAETAFMKAFLLEENHFLAEALKYYHLAAQLEPTNKKYKSAQLRFYD